MEIEKLSEEFVVSGKQPEFKKVFDFALITRKDDGAELIYLNLDEVPTVTKSIDNGELIVDLEKSVLICLKDLENSEIPNIVKNVAKFNSNDK